jgi:hypothetical protein
MENFTEAQQLLLERGRSGCRAGGSPGQPRFRRWIRRLQVRARGVWQGTRALTRSSGFSSAKNDGSGESKRQVAIHIK